MIIHSHVKKCGYFDITTLFADIVSNLLDNNLFTLVAEPLPGIWTLQANTCDPLSSTQPWRLHIDSTYVMNFKNVFIPEQGADLIGVIKEYGRIVVGTPAQLPDDGSVTYVPGIPSSSGYSDYDSSREYFIHPDNKASGSDYNEVTDTYGIRFTSEGNLGNLPIGDISPIFSEIDINYARPVTYDLVVSSRGFVLALSAEAHPTGQGSRFICVQRLGDAETGKTYTDLNSPVIAMFNSVDRGYLHTLAGGVDLKFADISGLKTVWQMVVREKEINVPCAPSKVMEFSDYAAAIWNPRRQTSIDDEGYYLITIPDGLVTNRYLYNNLRMDMIGFISANVCAEGHTAKDIEIFSKQFVEYKAHRCNIGYHEGSRLMFITKITSTDLINHPLLP